MTLPEARWWSVPSFWGSPRDRTVGVNLWYLSTRVWWEYSMSNTITLYILSLVSARIEREHSSSHDNGSKMDPWDKKLPGICFTATNAPPNWRIPTNCDGSRNVWHNYWNQEGRQKDIVNVPENVPLKLAVLAEPLTVAWCMVRVSQFVVGQNVLILGVGHLSNKMITRPKQGSGCVYQQSMQLGFQNPF